MSANEIVVGFLAGIIGTMVMDSTNSVLRRLYIIRSINLRGIGRLAHGWVRGKFIHDGKTPLLPVKNELLKGIIAHYSIGATFGVFFAIVIVLAKLKLGFILSAIVFGIVSTSAVWFAHFPALGWGIMGLKAPETKWALTSLVNHINYAIGLAIGMNLLGGLIASPYLKLY